MTQKVHAKTRGRRRKQEKQSKMPERINHFEILGIHVCAHLKVANVETNGIYMHQKNGDDRRKIVDPLRCTSKILKTSCWH